MSAPIAEAADRRERRLPCPLPEEGAGKQKELFKSISSVLNLNRGLEDREHCKRRWPCPDPSEQCAKLEGYKPRGAGCQRQ